MFGSLVVMITGSHVVMVKRTLFYAYQFSCDMEIFYYLCPSHIAFVRGGKGGVEGRQVGLGLRLLPKLTHGRGR